MEKIRLDPWVPTNKEFTQMRKDIEKIERSKKVQNAQKSILNGIELARAEKLSFRTQEIIIKRVEEARNFSIN